MLMLDWRFGMETSADFRGILCELTAGLNATFTVVEPWEFGPHNAQLNGPEGQCARGFAIEPAHPVTQTVLCAARSEMPGTPEPGLWHFATDGRYTAEAGIPTVGFGPGDPSLAHATREHIHVSDIVTAVHVLARAIQDAPPGAEVPSAT
jgi:acetylornithine deacetylase/succinyl-diaminopimelate desuccinylase-like protein